MINTYFKLTNKAGCTTTITDLTYENGGYVEEDTLDGVSFLSSVTLNVLVKKDAKGNESIKETFLTKHVDSSELLEYIDEGLIELESTTIDDIVGIGDLALEGGDLVTFQYPEDGHFKIQHLIVPTEDWINKFTLQDLMLAYNNSPVYYYDTASSKYYKLISTGEVVEVQVSELIEVNPTNFGRCCQDTFLICRLYNCYINFCNRIFELQINKCINKDNELLYYRDFVWMAINIIKYYIELGQIDEAQSLLELIIGCNGFCDQYSTTTLLNTDRGCGCK